MVRPPVPEIPQHIKDEIEARKTAAVKEQLDQQAKLAKQGKKPQYPTPPAAPKINAAELAKKKPSGFSQWMMLMDTGMGSALPEVSHVDGKPYTYHLPYRPENPATKQKNIARSSWGGFELSDRANQKKVYKDDLVAILEESGASAPKPRLNASKSNASRRMSRYKSNRQSRLVIEKPLAEAVAADPYGETYASLNSPVHAGPGALEASVPIDKDIAATYTAAVAALSPEPESAPQSKRKSFMRRMSRFGGGGGSSRRGSDVAFTHVDAAIRA